MCTSATPLTYGVSLYAADTTVVLQDVYIESNVISNVTNGIYCSSGSPPNYLRLYIRGNTVVAGYAADAGTGIYSFSASHQWVEICDNFITDFGTYGIRMVDNSRRFEGPGQQQPNR